MTSQEKESRISNYWRLVDGENQAIGSLKYDLKGLTKTNKQYDELINKQLPNIIKRLNKSIEEVDFGVEHFIKGYKR